MKKHILRKLFLPLSLLMVISVSATDMTSSIINPGFDANATTGWTGSGTVNYHVVEFYQKTFDMYQVISNLPAGKYRLKAQGYERPKSNDAGVAYKAKTEKISAQLYAKASSFAEKDTTFNSIYKYNYYGTGAVSGYVNTMAGAETMLSNASTKYYEMSVSDILVNAGDKLTIGAKSAFQQTGYWVLFDNFRLEYLGAYDINDFAKALNNRIAEAQNLKSKHIQTLLVNKLDTAILAAQSVVAVDSLIQTDLDTAKINLDAVVASAYNSLNAYVALQKTITDANRILGFLEKADEITKLQNAINSATVSYNNLDLTVTQVNSAKNLLKVITKSVGKQIYIASWMMGDVNSSANNWYIERTKQSKNFILFWEPGFGDEAVSIVDDCLNLAEKCFDYYADSLKFINKGASKTDTYKMVIRLRFTTEWEATGSGVDNTIGLLTLTPWALSSRGGQTIAHEVGHCFQYQTHCDNNDQNGWTYGFGANASGGNGWWEQCAQWQAYKVFPSQQFTSEWISGYLSNTHKNILNETYRYNDYFIQDYWCFKRGKDMIGRLWNKSYKPEDPVETYKRLNGLTQAKFNDEMWECAARFATWDIPAIKSYGAGTITTRPQPKLNNQGSYVWRIDSTVCVENYGHNIIRLNAPATSKIVTANFTGLAGTTGFRKNYTGFAGWRYGFVALLKNGSRVYGDIKSASMTENGGISSIDFTCPANCDKLWLVVSGSPSIHWRHAWDDNDANDEQWPYQVKFNNTNVYGYANVINGIENPEELNVSVITRGNLVLVSDIPEASTVTIYNLMGKILINQKVNADNFSTELSSGLYIVTIKSGQNLKTQKIIIQ